MAYRKQRTETGSCNVRECIDYYVKDADLTDHNTIMNSTLGLELMSNNHHFMRDLLKACLAKENNKMKEAFYSAQSFVLGSGKNEKSGKLFTLRGVIWPCADSNKKTESAYDSVFSYNQTHDHNFDFLTIGYSGSGYDTDLYTYDYNSTKGYLGEEVEIEKTESMRLSPGEIVLFRGSEDIHTQLHPKNLSVSINLLIDADEDKPFQYDFDLETSQIKEIIHSGASTEISLLRIAAEFGDRSLIPALEKRITGDADWKVKQDCLKTIIALEPENKLKVLDKMKPHFPREIQEIVFNQE